MASDRQIVANRLNALQSTGPKSDAGRAASRRNALKHGLTARSLIIEGEDPDLFEDLRTSLFATYQPTGVVEDQLVDMMAGILWRLRRVPALEAAAFSWMRRCHRNRALPGLGAPEGDALGSGRYNAALADEDAKSETAKQDLGRAVFQLVRDGDLLDKLSRYETHLMMQLGRVVGELEHQHAQRKTTLELPPLAAE